MSWVKVIVYPSTATDSFCAQLANINTNKFLVLVSESGGHVAFHSGYLHLGNARRMELGNPWERGWER